MAKCKHKEMTRAQMKETIKDLSQIIMWNCFERIDAGDSAQSPIMEIITSAVEMEKMRVFDQTMDLAKNHKKISKNLAHASKKTEKRN